MNIQNPAALFQIMNLWSRFQKNHPKFPKFLSAVVQNGIREGSIIEIKVTTADDMDMIRQLKNMSFNK